jgi:3-phenylpropionate/trans-cinnamate dioxygenase ferredoxin subunit
MSDWADVARTDEIPPGGSKLVYVDGVKVAVFNLGGEYHAIEDICTHDGGELASGTVEGEEIVCPRHGARFNIKTGAVTAPPAYEPVYKFPLRVEDGTIQIRDDRWK